MPKLRGVHLQASLAGRRFSKRNVFPLPGSATVFALLKYSATCFAAPPVWRDGTPQPEVMACKFGWHPSFQAWIVCWSCWQRASILSFPIVTILCSGKKCLDTTPTKGWSRFFAQTDSVFLLSEESWESRLIVLRIQAFPDTKEVFVRGI